MTERWLVVQTQPRREMWAAENISRLGYEFYFPKMQMMVDARAGLRVARIEPLFPRHLFVRSDQGQWRSLTGCWGVSGVIMCGESPGNVPLKEIHRMKALEDSHGMICLPENVKFVPGDKVRVSGGAMVGHVGIYEGDAPKDRIKVLLDVLGRKTMVLIAERFVEPV